MRVSSWQAAACCCACAALLCSAGLQEVRRIERMREKRAFEASLPPINDVARLPERQVSVT